MKINKTLVCFTASYPYGNKETYFENELSYLARKFDKIIIVPSYNPFGDEARIVPVNVEVFDVVLRRGHRRLIDFLINFRITKLHIKELFGKKIFFSHGRIKKWILSVLDYGTAYSKFKQYNFSSENTILYSYWAGKEFFIEPELASYYKIIRMHGGDFYEERNYGYLPLRKELYRSAQLLLPISRHISGILSSKYLINPRTIRVSYLGVSNDTKYCTLKEGNSLNIISCSNVYQLKRVDLIYRILQNINPNTQINWTHIGSGKLLDELKSLVLKDPRTNIKVNFVGQKTQNEIKEIYQNNYFDFFINTSQYEGIPVSIMEAFSFGIPAIATDVGGTAEIVTSNNGILIDKEFDIKMIAKKIEYYSNNNRTEVRKSALDSWLSNFDADKNYSDLISFLDV